MPYVYAPGRGQVDGQCSALQEKEESRVVRAACNNSALLRSLWPIPCILCIPCLWLPEQKFLDEEWSVPCGDDRSLRDVAPSPPMPYHVRIIFRETSFDCYTIFDSLGFPTSQISPKLGNIHSKTDARQTQRNGTTEMDSLACQPRTIDDYIAWQFTQPVF